MQDGFYRVAAASPKVTVADPHANARAMAQLIRRAAGEGAGAICFPELSLTGATCGDLFRSRTLLQGAEAALAQLMADTADLDILCVVGVPVPRGGSLTDAVAVFHRGELLGLSTKTCLSSASGLSQSRHFTPGPQPYEALTFAGQETVLGPRLLFECENVEGLTLGAVPGEDLWASSSAGDLTAAGATVLLHPTAAPELAGRASRLREALQARSAQCLCAIVSAGAGWGESTTDLVFSGHDLMAENGALLGESPLFAEEETLLLADIDLERLTQERRRTDTWQDREEGDWLHLPFAYEEATLAAFRPRRVERRSPFLPEDPAQAEERCALLLTMQAAALATRLEKIHCRHLVLNLSGGLDSTLALLAAVRAFDRLKLPRTGIHTLTLPCFGTTSRTKSNAQQMAEALGVEFRTISIEKAVLQHFADIGQDPENYDVTFENAQARERTQVAMDVANQLGGLVLGTGDLSELALGWATYNGDHMSMYGVNASIPKTLVRHLVRYEADHTDNAALAAALRDVLDTPVSPELLPPKDGEIAQKTEELVGPYELHDFFLYYLVRYGFAPGKLYRMACRSFSGVYDPATVKAWLRTFLRRFFTQQFKRSCSPDGPKVGSVSLSPRGDWVMPSDASAALWLEEVDAL